MRCYNCSPTPFPLMQQHNELSVVKIEESKEKSSPRGQQVASLCLKLRKIAVVFRRVPFRRSGQVAAPEVVRCPPSDSDLLSSMAARLAQAESQLQMAWEEVREKEARIRELERRLSSLLPVPSHDNQQLLRKRCEALQRQVQEMEVPLQSASHLLFYTVAAVFL